jgi:glycosyltransferase involved in cell wall biosynthesis
MAATPRCSIIVRTRNEAESIGRTLDLIAAQTVAREGGAEVIVVDSGSTDNTTDIVRSRAGVRLIEIPAASFTYGGALNTGAQAASAPLLVALSAHAFPTDERWLARLLGAFEDERVAAASGELFDWDDQPLHGPRIQDLQIARRNPYWGYSNAAGGFRADLWREHQFRADMPFSEDKEFAWHWLNEGRVVAIDPSLVVDHDHSKDPLPVLYSRSCAKWEAFSMYLEVPPYPLTHLVREWWTERGSWRSHARARLSHRRAAALIGKFAGLRRGRRMQGRT